MTVTPRNRYFYVTLATFIALPLTIDPAIAQRPIAVDEIGSGRRVSGWAVEAIPYRRGPHRPGLASIEQVMPNFFGQTGSVTYSILPNNTFYPGPPGLGYVHYGRGLMKIDRSGNYALAMTVGAPQWGSCVIILRFSNRDVGMIRIYGTPRRAEPAIKVTSFNLDPGYYKIEYVFGCDDNVQGAHYRIQIREDIDTQLRDFKPSELFHVRQ